MNCSRMHLSERRYKPPPRVSKCDSATPTMIRPCAQRFALSESPHRFSSIRSIRSASPQTTNSDPSSSEGSKIPLIICNLDIALDAKTLAPKNIRRTAKKLPPFCVQYQNSMSKSCAVQESNMKTINDFIVQGTLIANHRRRVRQKSHAAHQDSPDIIINCEDDECDECISDIAMNVFNNINTDLLLSLDCYEMDSFGRLPGDSRTPTPIPLSSTNIAPSTTGTVSVAANPTLLAVPAGYRPLSLRTPSPNTRSIIRIDLVNRDKIKAEPNIKEINYNVHRLKEKRGIRDVKSEKPS